MRNILLLLVLGLTFSSSAFSQIKISKTPKAEKITKVGTLGVTRLELSRNIIEGDTIYYVTYVNNAFKQLTKYESFYLQATTEDMLQLEQAFLDVINGADDAENVSIELGEKEYHLAKSKVLGIGVLRLWHSSYDYVDLAEKEIKKLFSSFHKE